MLFMLGGIWTPPYVHIPPICLYDPYIHTPPGVYTPPHVHHTPLCICIFSGFCMLWGIVRDPLHVGHLLYTSPVWGCLLFSYPHSFSGFPVHWYVWGISVCHGDFSLILGVWWGVPPSFQGFWGTSTWDVHMLILVHFGSSLCLMF